MFETLAECLLTGLKIWEHKDKTKYIDQVVELKRKRYAEQNKPSDRRSDAVLDNIEFELRIVATAWASVAGKSDT